MDNLREGLEVITRGQRKAILSPQGGGRYTVWVGYIGTGGEDISAHWFRGGRTCGAEYSSHRRALAAAERFLAH